MLNINLKSEYISLSKLDSLMVSQDKLKSPAIYRHLTQLWIISCSNVQKRFDHLMQCNDLQRYRNLKITLHVTHLDTKRKVMHLPIPIPFSLSKLGLVNFNWQLNMKEFSFGNK